MNVWRMRAIFSDTCVKENCHITLSLGQICVRQRAAPSSDNLFVSVHVPPWGENVDLSYVFECNPLFDAPGPNDDSDRLASFILR